MGAAGHGRLVGADPARRTPTGAALARNDGGPGRRRRSPSVGALGAPGGLGLLLAAPTIATHGTQEQIDTYVADIVTGQQAWCQLFSEPGAGSDLAGLRPRAVKDGDEWIVNGQKVWTSVGQRRRPRACCSPAPTPTSPSTRASRYFAFDMHQPGVEVRPLREMTGRALFNEVFLTDARVADDASIGGLQQRLGGRQRHARLRARRPRRRRRARRRRSRPRPARSPVTSTGGPATSSARKAAKAGARWPWSTGSASCCIDLAGQRQPSATRRCARTSCGCTRSARSAATTACG